MAFLTKDGTMIVFVLKYIGRKPEGMVVPEGTKWLHDKRGYKFVNETKFTQRVHEVDAATLLEVNPRLFEVIVKDEIMTSDYFKDEEHVGKGKPVDPDGDKQPGGTELVWPAPLEASLEQLDAMDRDQLKEYAIQCFGEDEETGWKARGIKWGKADDMRSQIFDAIRAEIKGRADAVNADDDPKPGEEGQE